MRDVIIGCLIFGTLLVAAIVWLKISEKKDNKESLVETYIDPIYPDRQKLEYDWYPLSNGSIYGEYSTIFSGYPYYDSAY